MRAFDGARFSLSKVAHCHRLPTRDQLLFTSTLIISFSCEQLQYRQRMDPFKLTLQQCRRLKISFRHRTTLTENKHDNRLNIRISFYIRIPSS